MVDFKKLNERMAEQRAMSPEQQERERKERWSRIEKEQAERDNNLEKIVSRLMDDPRLNDWEKKFVSDMVNSFGHPSRKYFSDAQMSTMEKLGKLYPENEPIENQISSDFESNPALFAIVDETGSRFSIYTSKNGQDLQCAFFMKGIEKDAMGNIIKDRSDFAKSSFVPKQSEDGTKYYEASGFGNPNQIAKRFSARLDGYENTNLQLTLRYGDDRMKHLPLIYSNSVSPNKAMLDARFENDLVKMIRNYLGIDVSLANRKLQNPVIMTNDEISGDEYENDAENERQRHQHEGGFGDDVF